MASIIEEAKKQLDGKPPAEAAQMLINASKYNKQLRALIAEAVHLDSTEEAIGQFIGQKINGAPEFRSLMEWLGEPGRFTWGVAVIGEMKKLHQVPPAQKRSGF